MKPMSVTFKSIEQLNTYYVKEFKNGGFFLPTEDQSENFKPNEKISLTVNLLGETKVILSGRVSYIAPQNNNQGNNEGIGIALDSNKENKSFKEKIEELLKDKLSLNKNIFNNNNHKE